MEVCLMYCKYFQQSIFQRIKTIFTSKITFSFKIMRRTIVKVYLTYSIRHYIDQRVVFDKSNEFKIDFKFK